MCHHSHASALEIVANMSLSPPQQKWPSALRHAGGTAVPGVTVGKAGEKLCPDHLHRNQFEVPLLDTWNNPFTRLGITHSHFLSFWGSRSFILYIYISKNLLFIGVMAIIYLVKN